MYLVIIDSYTWERFCLSVSGLWNGFTMEVYQYPNMKQFQMNYKDSIFKRYKDEKGRSVLSILFVFSFTNTAYLLIE